MSISMDGRTIYIYSLFMQYVLYPNGKHTAMKQQSRYLFLLFNLASEIRNLVGLLDWEDL